VSDAGDGRPDAGDAEPPDAGGGPRTRLRWGGATDTGRLRTVNQDTFLVLADQDLYMVADGMGGPQGGDVAARLAVDTVRDGYLDHTVDGLTEAVLAANAAVHERGEGDEALRGMGTTLVAVALIESFGQEVLAIANVGDSRAYRFADGELEQLTEDHSLVADMMRAGRLSPQEAESHPQRNIVTRALGPYADIEVDVLEVYPRTGDRFLLASDGLFNEVSSDQIAAVLRRLDDPDDACHELVRLANEGGGRDNITCVVVDVTDDGGRAEAASAALADEPAPPPSRPRTGDVDVAGFSTAVGDDMVGAATAAEVDDAAAAPSRRQRRKLERARGERPRRFTWRVALFTLLVLGVLGGAVGTVFWYGRNAYYVGLDGDRVAIFRGRPGGLLWIEPELVERTDLRLSDIQAPYDRDIENDKELATRQEADEYLDNVRREGTTTTAGSTSTTSTIASPGAPATTTTTG
jgi:protein phosphatase